MYSSFGGGDRVTPMQARLAAALHRLTDLPRKDCQAFFAEDE